MILRRRRLVACAPFSVRGGLPPVAACGCPSPCREEARADCAPGGRPRARTRSDLRARRLLNSRGSSPACDALTPPSLHHAPIRRGAGTVFRACPAPARPEQGHRGARADLACVLRRIPGHEPHPIFALATPGDGARGTASRGFCDGQCLGHRQTPRVPATRSLRRTIPCRVRGGPVDYAAACPAGMHMTPSVPNPHKCLAVARFAEACLRSVGSGESDLPDAHHQERERNALLPNWHSG